MVEHSAVQNKAGPAQQQLEPPVEYRAATLEEDDVLSRILCNAFLPVWNHNWFHVVTEPLEPVAVGTVNSPPPPMSRQQTSRVRFYWSLVKLVRLLGGDVLVAEVPGSDDTRGTEKDIGAILLWLPPFKRMSTFDLVNIWKSGYLSLALPWHYGLTGFYRIDMIFEANVHSMFAKTLPDLPPNGFQEDECGFVQMIASNPKYAGKGYASSLLQYRMEQHFAQFPDRPVILDTTTPQGIRAYEKLGFRLLAQVPVDTDTDARGIRLTKSATDEVKRQAKKTCVQSVMVRLP